MSGSAGGKVKQQSKSDMSFLQYSHLRFHWSYVVFSLKGFCATLVLLDPFWVQLLSRSFALVSRVFRGMERSLRYLRNTGEDD